MAIPWNEIMGIIQGVGQALGAQTTQKRQSFGADRVGGAANAFENNFNVLNAINRSSLGASAAGPSIPNLFSGVEGGGAIDFGRLPGSGREQTLGADFGSAIDQVNLTAQNRPLFLGSPEGLDIPNVFGDRTGLGGNGNGNGEDGRRGGGAGGGGTRGAAAIGGNPFGGGGDPGAFGGGDLGREFRPNVLEAGETFDDPDQQYWANLAAGIYDDPDNPNGSFRVLLPFLKTMGRTAVEAFGLFTFGRSGLADQVFGGETERPSNLPYDPNSLEINPSTPGLEFGPPGGGGGGRGGEGVGQGFGGGTDLSTLDFSDNAASFQTHPGMFRQVPGQPGQPVPIMAHGGEFVGRPGGAPQAGPPAPAPGAAPPQQPIAGSPLALPPAGGTTGSAVPPPALTPAATIPNAGAPLPAAPAGPQQTPPPSGAPQGAMLEDEQFVSAASLLGSLGAI